MIVSIDYNIFLFVVEEMKNKQISPEVANFKVYSNKKDQHILNSPTNLFISLPSDKNNKSVQRSG